MNGEHLAELGLPPIDRHDVERVFADEEARAVREREQPRPRTEEFEAQLERLAERKGHVLVT